MRERGRKKRGRELEALALLISQRFNSIINPVSAKRVCKKSDPVRGWWQAKGIKQGKCFGGLVGKRHFWAGLYWEVELGRTSRQEVAGRRDKQWQLMGQRDSGGRGSGAVLLPTKFIAYCMCRVRKADFVVQPRTWKGSICNLKKELMLWENHLNWV